MEHSTHENVSHDQAIPSQLDPCEPNAPHNTSTIQDTVDLNVQGPTESVEGIGESETASIQEPEATTTTPKPRRTYRRSPKARRRRKVVYSIRRKRSRRADDTEDVDVKAVNTSDWNWNDCEAYFEPISEAAIAELERLKAESEKLVAETGLQAFNQRGRFYGDLWEEYEFLKEQNMLQHRTRSKSKKVDEDAVLRSNHQLVHGYDDDSHMEYLKYLESQHAERESVYKTSGPFIAKFLSL